MGGPSARVLLRAPLGADQLNTLLHQAFEPVECITGVSWHLTDPAALGMTDTQVEAGPLEVNPRVWQRDDDLTKHIGFRPAAEIGVISARKSRDDHRVLGHLCLALALFDDGLIDFHGGLVPFPWPSEIDVLPQKRTRQQCDFLLERIAKKMSKLPGRLYEIRYRTGPGRHWVHHIGDAEFLDAWLRHPNFRMIK